MPLSIRLSAYLVLPLLLAGTSFQLMDTLADAYEENLPLLIRVGMALLPGLLPIALYRVFIHRRLQSGFACLDDGRVMLPRELQLAMVLGKHIVRWQPFTLPLNTTVRLHGDDEELLVQIRVFLTIPPDKAGKQVVQQLDAVLTLVEVSIQEALYSASLEDAYLGRGLNGSTPRNDEDERLLKSKFLSAMEMLTIEGIAFPHDAAGIEIDHNVRKERIVGSAPQPPADDTGTDDLQLDPALLKTLGMA